MKSLKVGDKVVVHYDLSPSVNATVIEDPNGMFVDLKADDGGYIFFALIEKCELRG